MASSEPGAIMDMLVLPVLTLIFPISVSFSSFSKGAIDIVAVPVCIALKTNLYTISLSTLVPVAHITGIFPLELSALISPLTYDNFVLSYIIS